MKKILIIALAGAFSITAFTGCAKSDKQSDTAAKTTAPQTTEQNSTGEVSTTTPITIDMPDAVHLNDAGELEIILESNLTTGYSWSCNNSNDTVLKFMNNEYQKDSNDSENTGEGGSEHFFFSPVGDGIVSLTFKYSRLNQSTGYLKSVYKTYSVSGNVVSLLDEDEAESFTGKVTASANNSLTVESDGISMEFVTDNITVPIGEFVTVVYEHDGADDTNKATEISSDENPEDLQE